MRVLAFQGLLALQTDAGVMARRLGSCSLVGWVGLHGTLVWGIVR